MPKPATAEQARMIEEVSLPEEILRPTAPIVRCRVVYLGAMRNKSVALRGQIHETFIESPDGAITRKDRETGEERKYDVLKEAVDNGITSYDFSSHDIRGRLIKERLMPDSAREGLRGKPFSYCEHVGHLREFYMTRGADGEKEFEVMARPEDVALIQDFVRRSERAKRQQDALFSEVTESR